MQLGLAAWHRYMVCNDPDLLTDLIADDAVFHSPVVHTPQAGKQKVLMYLTAAGKVLGNDSFRYVRELVDGPEALLEFMSEIDGITINGIDLIRFDLDGDFSQVERVAERDQLMRLFRRHDPGDAGGGENIALFRLSRQAQSQRLRRHDHRATGYRLPLGARLGGDIDHMGLARLGEVG